ncbi:CopG family ribbon-helix-helix protein [Acidipropionibacterium virtanenii]|uniref:Ribbon-helix-helix protein CopG domain-containing protein n=1 Tax=Acidipropionibacterium virtanenii TaxID=2057246 RepID=A0A344UPU9_9ACTN|nr:ribbon-helix-helix protein, CopG family [Acidipropionibacterium virtanenii]AXE37297.1 hypothetical protein JS278_00100 [Acidipropionibacterium virtanenii]
MAKSYGTVDGVEITDDVIEDLVSNAEAGFPGVTPHRMPGRPALGSGPAKTVAVRLDPKLLEALRQRAEHDDQTPSEVIREALRQFLRPTC